MFPNLNISQRIFHSQIDAPTTHAQVQPHTKKTSVAGVGETFSYALSSMQGWRETMEDTYCIKVPLDSWQPFSDWSFFAVFDGHSGGRVATLAADRLLRTIQKSEAFRNMSHRFMEHGGLMDKTALKLLREGIRDAFLTFDEDSRKLCDALDMSGTAALCAFVTPTHIVLVNCGDSRAILSRLNSFVETTDHKPTAAAEAERIEKAGGAVIHERVNGVLGLSRSLGDYLYKTDKRLSAVEQLVSPEPDVYVIERDKSDDEFLILACDGVYEAFSSEELVYLARSRLAVTDDLVAVTSQLLDMALSEGSRDNLSLILVVFDAAPRPSKPAIERETTWWHQLRAKIAGKGVRSRLALMSEPSMDDQDIRTVLAQEGLDDVPPGGLHLARLWIDQRLRSPLKPK